MNKIYINNIGGLYDELYNPDFFYRTDCSIVQNEYLDANSVFWHKILDSQNISYIVNLLIENKTTLSNMTYRDLSIIANPNLFIQNVLQARDNICDQGISPRAFFQYIETLEILCDLYSRYYFLPYRFSLTQGIEFDELSSKKILEVALNPSINPLYTWIKSDIFPLLADYAPDIVFFEGRPSVFFATLAIMLKKYNVNIKLCITRHSSEYFSLNKIDFCLKKNTFIFSYIDIIVLEYFTQTENAILEALKEKKSLNCINNIIYINAQGKIIQTPYQKVAQNTAILERRKKSQNCTYCISPDKILNIHLEPYKKCYWNKCTFCGINKKYHFSDMPSENKLEEQLHYIKNYITENSIKYVWLIDEAIYPDDLRNIATYIIENQIHIYWQVRCRIEKALLQEDLPKLLAKAGLKEIRLGLESGSKYILKLMQKFDNDFSFDLLEEIVCTYSNYGISIHVPIIIGFPGESKTERQKTYELLSYLRRKYELFTFNINILGMDISSTLFREWYKYDIEDVHFPYPKSEYLGNLLEWKSEYFDYELLDRERNAFMREMLYPWMPQNSLCKPYIFYRFSETIRNTLIWKTKRLISPVIEKKNYIVKCSDNTVVTSIDKDVFLIYQWNSHHYLRVNKTFLNIYNVWRTPKSIEDGLSSVKDSLSVSCTNWDLINIIIRLIENKFLSVENDKTATCISKISLENTYDRLYYEKNFPYAIKTDNWLKHYKNQIPIGTAFEIGIGTGKNIPMLLESGYEIHGIDISGQAIRDLKNNFPSTKCSFTQADIRNYQIKPNTYELIVCSMVLHYIDYNELVDIAAKIQNGLKSNGYLFVSVLSKKDPLNYVESSENQYVKTFFSCGMIKKLFNKLQIIEISDTYSFEPLRKHPADYFGLILYMGKKKI